MFFWSLLETDRIAVVTLSVESQRYILFNSIEMDIYETTKRFASFE